MWTIAEQCFHTTQSLDQPDPPQEIVLPGFLSSGLHIRYLFTCLPMRLNLHKKGSPISILAGTWGSGFFSRRFAPPGGGGALFDPQWESGFWGGQCHGVLRFPWGKCRLPVPSARSAGTLLISSKDPERFCPGVDPYVRCAPYVCHGPLVEDLRGDAFWETPGPPHNTQWSKRPVKEECLVRYFAGAEAVRSRCQAMVGAGLVSVCVVGWQRPAANRARMGMGRGCMAVDPKPLAPQRTLGDWDGVELV